MMLFKKLLQSTIALNLLLGLSYFLFAKFGFEWGALTANATLLWPPSGLALFAFLTFGKRVFPGIFIGALLASQLLTLSHSIGNTPFAFFIAGLNGLASASQALIIAYWTRPCYVKTFRVYTRTACNFTIKVLAGCTIAATVSNLVLWQTGIINFADVIQNWAVWWMGDSIGMLIIAPLLLWIYHRDDFHNNSQANAFLIFCAGIGTVLLTVAAIGHNEREAHKKNILHQVSSLQTAMQSNIDLASHDLDTLQEYFLNTTPAREEFRNLTEPLLKRNQWVDSFSWLPITEDNKNNAAPITLSVDYSAGLTLARLSGPDFLWRQPDSQNYPQAFLATIKTTLKPGYTDVLMRNDPNNSALGNIPVINLVEPIYFCGATNNTECKIYNLVSSELNLNTLMRVALSKTDNPSLDIKLAIITQQNTISNWLWNQDHWQLAPENTTGSFNKKALTISGKTPTLHIMNGEWQLLITPVDISAWYLPSIFQLIILAIGVTLTVLLTAYLQALHKHDQLVVENQLRLEREIAEQTNALRVANDWLLKEIEEKRTTQEQLKANENHLRTLLDNIPDPIWFKSNEGEYINFNKAVSNMFNRTQQEVAGKTAGDFTDETFEKAIKEFEQLALSSRKAVRKSLWMFVPQHGQHRLMDTLKVAVRDEQQHSIGILSIARDITEQYELIDELEKFKRFAEFASEGLGIMSLDGKTLYMNPSMNKMLNGNREQETYKEHFAHYYPLDIQQHLLQHIFPQVLTTGHWQGELAALHVDGLRFPTKETFFIIRDDQGKPLYLGDVMTDISEQKQTESALQLAKDKAEDATRAKSRFLANMSHEIRTPLNAVLGYSQLLISDTQLNVQQRERMNAILNAGQRLLHLINDILDLSKIEAGALHLRQDYFDLHKELNDIISLMTTKANTKGLALNHDIQLPLPAIIKSDRQKIGQIILNILGNAIKFTSAGYIQLSVTANPHNIEFTITDTGPGIAAQELTLLFAAFKQGKAGEDSGGTGLGLVISKHIAENLGGELTLESEPGKGTRAHLRLPLTIEYNTELDINPQITTTKLAPNATCRVLVVEDDIASRDVLSNLLRDIGCTVIEANNGNEGLHLALREPLDIIFTDIRMPELNGSDMLKKLREDISYEALPVIAVSASSLEHERTFYLGEGFHEFIGKPYQFRDIYTTLSKFTKASFVGDDIETKIETDTTPDKIIWQKGPLLEQLVQQLQQLKAAMDSGNMNTSKKLWALQSAHTIGKQTHQQIQNALRQYNLELAEKILTELLAEIEQTVTNNH